MAENYLQDHAIQAIIEPDGSVTPANEAINSMFKILGVCHAKGSQYHVIKCPGKDGSNLVKTSTAEHCGSNCIFAALTDGHDSPPFMCETCEDMAAAAFWNRSSMVREYKTLAFRMADFQKSKVDAVPNAAVQPKQPVVQSQISAGPKPTPAGKRQCEVVLDIEAEIRAVKENDPDRALLLDKEQELLLINAEQEYLEQNCGLQTVEQLIESSQQAVAKPARYSSSRTGLNSRLFKRRSMNDDRMNDDRMEE